MLPRLRTIALAFAITLGPTLAFADLLVLANGDRLNGTLKSLVDGKVRFDSGPLGTLTVPAESIAAVQVDREVRVVLADGRTFKGMIDLGAQGTLTLRSGDADQALTWDAITAIDPPSPAKAAWKGTASSNLNFSRSNTQSQSFNVDVDLKRRSASDETTFSAAYLYGQQTLPSGGSSTTQDAWRVQGQYNRFKSDRFFGFGSLRLERDGIVDLDLRSIVGGGAGWRLLKQGTTEMWFEGGVSHLREMFAGAVGARERLTGQFSYRFRTDLFRRFELAHDVDYFPTLSDLSDSYLSSRLTLRTALAENLFANARFVYDLDASPAPGSRKDSSKYTFGIGYRF